MELSLSRRAFLGTACSLAASPLMTPVVFAAAPVSMGSWSGRAAISSSTAGMMLGMQFLHALPGHVGVDLRGGQVTVPEQHLYDPQVGAVIEQVSCECMPQRMG